METQSAHHLGLQRDDLQGSTIVLMPGDPGRVPLISSCLEDPRELAFTREFRTHLGTLDGHPALVTSSGCGGPSLSVAVEELACLGVRTFIRVGSTGSLQEQVKAGDLVISNAAVRLDGASRDFAPLPYPAVADFWVTQALVQAAQGQEQGWHVGISASTDTFYPGQERYQTHSGYVLPRLQGSVDQWRALNVLNMEMETATLFTMASALGLQAGSICGVVAERGVSDRIVAREQFEPIIRSTVQVATEAVRSLLNSCSRADSGERL